MKQTLRFITIVLAAVFLLGVAALHGQGPSLGDPSQPAAFAGSLINSEPNAPPSLFLQPLPPVNDVRQIQPPSNLTPVAVAAPILVRSEQMEQIARQADRQTRRGFELAGRGAYFAARAEFLGALKLVADGLDTEQRTDRHGRAFAAALTAMREAEDFLPRGSKLENEVNVAMIAASHDTPAIKKAEGTISPIVAVKRYMTYAQEQFAAAVDHEVAGSIALHALGKLHGAMAKKKIGLVAANEPKAIVFYQSALLAYPRNYMAANDLGVLLAQCGEPSQAKAVLEHSLALSQQSATWNNLSVIYRQLNMTAASNQAARQAVVVQQAEMARRRAILGTAQDTVQWVDPQTFAQTSTTAPDTNGGNPRGSQPAVVGKAPARPSTAERMSWGVNQR